MDPAVVISSLCRWDIQKQLVGRRTTGVTIMGGIVIFACSLSTGWTKLANFGTM